MSVFVSMLMLVLAISIDGFGVGITYGIRKIRISWLAITIISTCSGMVMYVSMSLGLWMSSITEGHAELIGGVILIAIGLGAVTQSLRRNDNKTPKEHNNKNKTKRWGMVFGILRTPSTADLDRSGTISPGEAALLGTALSLDAFGAGIGASMLGFSPFATACLTALCCGCFIGAGLYAGRMVKGIGRFKILPGLILILMGVWKGFF